MNIKTIVTIGSLVVGSYWTGKIVGLHDGAKAVMDEYKDAIPENKLGLIVFRKAGCKLSVIAKKDK